MKKLIIALFICSISFIGCAEFDDPEVATQTNQIDIDQLAETSIEKTEEVITLLSPYAPEGIFIKAIKLQIEKASFQDDSACEEEGDVCRCLQEDQEDVCADFCTHVYNISLNPSDFRDGLEESLVNGIRTCDKAAQMYGCPPGLASCDNSESDKFQCMGDTISDVYNGNSPGGNCIKP